MHAGLIAQLRPSPGMLPWGVEAYAVGIVRELPHEALRNVYTLPPRPFLTHTVREGQGSFAI
jgi:hypothetical protein